MSDALTMMRIEINICCCQRTMVGNIYENMTHLMNCSQWRRIDIRTGVTDKMPIYEYECTSCCNVFEVFQRMTEGPLSICPDCSGQVKKIVSISSFQLKGGGWYSDG